MSFFDSKEVFNNFYDRLRDPLLSRSQLSCVGDYPHKMAEIQCFWRSNINYHNCHPQRLDILPRLIKQLIPWTKRDVVK